MDEEPDLPEPPFTPIAMKPRHDGWTPHRQWEFIQRLADTGSVASAARGVNMTPQSAWRLRRHPHAAAFRRAWDGAMDQAGAQLRQAALERVLHGTAETVERAGKAIVTRYRPCSDRLLIFMLEREESAAERRHSAGLGAENSPAPDRQGPELTRLAIETEALPDFAGFDSEPRDAWKVAETPFSPRIMLSEVTLISPDSTRAAPVSTRPRVRPPAAAAPPKPPRLRNF